jgi:hypothetical protein
MAVPTIEESRDRSAPGWVRHDQLGLSARKIAHLNMYDFPMPFRCALDAAEDD